MPTRRTYLATVLTGTVGAVSGCRGVRTGTEETTSDAERSGAATTDGEPPPGGWTARETETAVNPEGQFRNWLYAPGEFGDNDHYLARALDAATVEEHESHLSDGADAIFHGFAETYQRQHGLKRDDLRTVVDLGLGRVLAGPFASTAVSRELRDLDYTQATTHGGYTVYAKADAPRAFGVRDKTLVVGTTDSYDATTDDDPQDIVEGLIDTARGTVDRYPSENEDMATVLAALSPVTYLSAGTRPEVEDGTPDSGTFDGQVASGFGWQVSGETTSFEGVVVFSDAEKATAADIDDWVEEDEFDDYTDLTVDTDGRSATVTARIDTADLFER